MRVLCSTGAVTYYPTRADHRLVADARELPAGGFELSIAATRGRVTSCPARAASTSTASWPACANRATTER
jgi:hypothetical protein